MANGRRQIISYNPRRQPQPRDQPQHNGNKRRGDEHGAEREALGTPGYPQRSSDYHDDDHDKPIGRIQSQRSWLSFEIESENVIIIKNVCRARTWQMTEYDLINRWLAWPNHQNDVPRIGVDLHS